MGEILVNIVNRKNDRKIGVRLEIEKQPEKTPAQPIIRLVLYLYGDKNETTDPDNNDPKNEAAINFYIYPSVGYGKMEILRLDHLSAYYSCFAVCGVTAITRAVIKCWKVAWNTSDKDVTAFINCLKSKGADLGNELTTCVIGCFAAMGV